MVWTTNIYDPSITRIIAFSDIHSDIHALIIALRDCARVIRKKDCSNPIKLDIETEKLLEMDLNVDNDKYIDDLNYEWCGDNTHIVICGDILDGYRVDYPKFKRISSANSRCGVECLEHEYDQIEIKIYRFINALNENSGYKFHKILGNHEIINLFDKLPDIAPNYSTYIPDKTRDLGFYYYNGLSRTDYFKWNQEGGKIIFKDGVGIFLKINNNLFVHGRIEHTKTLDDYIEINNEININMSDELNYKLVDNDGFGSTLFDRYYNNLNNLKINQHDKCIKIKDNLKNFIVKTEPYNINDFRIIIGHCVQSFTHYYGLTNSTFTKIIKDGNREILNDLVYTGHVNVDSKDNKIFGIAMECDKITLDNPQPFVNPYEDDVEIDNSLDDNERFIYKVDIGTSRAFDDEKIPIDKRTEKLFYGSRVPQVLEIGKHVQILRSTIKNTRIHQPRYKYESIVSKIPELNKDIYKKYIVYISTMFHLLYLF